MSDYAIGDVQGCYNELRRLLDCIQYNEHTDNLWFVGDLVNRGPHSLQVLRFLKALPRVGVILGNHDLHLLARLFGQQKRNEKEDSLHEIITAVDGEELGHWLRQQPLIYHHKALKVVLCHAGILPLWDLDQAKIYAQEVQQMLQGEFYPEYLSHLYGNEADEKEAELSPIARLRFITNCFTRMRFCDKNGRLALNYKGNLTDAPAHLYPWFLVPGRQPIAFDIVFGHWAALQGKCPIATIHAIDTGCLWGGELTALRLQDKRRFAVPGFGSRV